MKQIVESIGRVTDIMQEITAATQEQTAGIEQINQAIAQMDQVTQQNTALVEQASSAAESMKEQATGLVQVVSVFRLDGRGASVMPTLVAPKPQRALPASGNKVPGRAKSAVPAERSRAIPTTTRTTTEIGRPAKPHAGAPAGSGGDWEEF